MATIPTDSYYVESCFPAFQICSSPSTNQGFALQWYLVPCLCRLLGQCQLAPAYSGFHKHITYVIPTYNQSLRLLRLPHRWNTSLYLLDTTCLASAFLRSLYDPSWPAAEHSMAHFYKSSHWTSCFSMFIVGVCA